MSKNAKMLIMLFVLAIMQLMCVGGCDDNTSRIVVYKNTIDKLQEASISAQRFIEQSQPIIDQARAAVAAGILSQEKLDSILDETNKAIEIKAAADEQVIQLQALLNEVLARDNIGFDDELQVIGNAISGAGKVIPPPYGTYMTIAGVLIAALAGFFGGSRKESAKTGEIKTALVNVVKSVDKALDSVDTSASDALKKILADTQTTETRGLVRTIKEPSLP